MSAILERHRAAAAALPEAKLVIDGRDVLEASGGYVPHVNPTTGAAQGDVVVGAAAEVDAAVAAARRALPGWRRMPGGGRRDLLLRLAALIAADAERLATIATLEMGGTRRLAVDGLMPFVHEWLHYFAGWADKIDGTFSGNAGAGPLDLVLPEPYGVVGLIVAWNGPLMGLAMKAAPALAAGNTVVVKPPETAPFSVIRFAELAREAGFPDGVVNVVAGGAEAGDRLSRHPGVDKLSFTGSPATARAIIAASAGPITPLVLELGGKSANLVFPDADVAAAVALAGFYPFVNAGQICVSPSRLLVHTDVFDEVAERVAAMARAIVLGDPLDDATGMGPMFSAAARDRALGFVERAVARPGVELLAGGQANGPAAGWFMAPTVLADPDPKSELSQTEVFGPVVAIHRFRSEDEAVGMANGTAYGLSAYVNTRDVDRALRLARALHAGGVYVNQSVPVRNPQLPFGGVGSSGYGREGGRAGLDEFIRLKAVSINVVE